jgi:hypothetical protein
MLNSAHTATGNAAPMLDGAVWEEELRAHDANTGLLGVSNEFAEPSRIVDQHVIVEEDKDVTMSSGCTNIVDFRKIKLKGVFGDDHVGARSQMIQKIKGPCVNRIIVNDDKLDLS